VLFASQMLWYIFASISVNKVNPTNLHSVYHSLIDFVVIMLIVFLCSAIASVLIIILHVCNIILHVCNITCERHCQCFNNYIACM